MLRIEQDIPLGPKTTMRIGGKARWYSEVKTKEECEEAAQFAREKNIPLIVLGSGSNTIFADGVIEALVVRILAQNVRVMPSSAADPSIHPSPASQDQDTRDDTAARIEASLVHIEAGKNLAQLISELAEKNLDLSPLTGIPGTVGGAIFGNAGQGYGGIWIGNYVQNVEVFLGDSWKTFSKEECEFSYRESAFKNLLKAKTYNLTPGLIIWSATLAIPSRPREEVKAEVERLLKKRIETQPHVKTAGSCFVSLPDCTPAWKVIDAAGLRGKKVGGVSISEKHANFLIAEKGATFEDAKTLIDEVKRDASQPLHVEMRLIGETGEIIV